MPVPSWQSSVKIGPRSHAFVPRPAAAWSWTTAIVVAQVWRDVSGRQAELARLLKAVDVRSIDESTGREAGILLARACTNDPIDATLVLTAADGDRILTSDPKDVSHVAEAAGKRVVIVAC